MIIQEYSLDTKVNQGIGSLITTVGLDRKAST